MSKATCYYLKVSEYGTPYLSKETANRLDIHEGDIIGIWNYGNWFYCVNPRKAEDAAIMLTLEDVNAMAMECICNRAVDSQEINFEA